MIVKDPTTLQTHFQVVACLCICQGRFLLLRRVLDRSFPEHWGIPGGKLEEDESIEHAALRELFEETAIVLSSHNLTHLAQYFVTHDNFDFSYDLFLVRFKTLPFVSLRPSEHNDYRWATISEALSLPLVTDLDSILHDQKEHLWSEGEQIPLFSADASFDPKPIEKIEMMAREIRPATLSLPFGDSRGRWWAALGPPGAGKTTALKEMTKKNEALSVSEQSTILKRGTRLNEILRLIFMEGQKQHFFEFQMNVLPARLWQVLNATYPALVDETIYSALAYTRALYFLGWISEIDYEIFYINYLAYADLLPPPEAVFYFDCPVHVLQERIMHRNREHESTYSTEYIEALVCSSAQIAHELSVSFRVIQIDTQRSSPNEIAQKYTPSP